MRNEYRIQSMKKVDITDRLMDELQDEANEIKDSRIDKEIREIKARLVNLRSFLLMGQEND